MNRLIKCLSLYFPFVSAATFHFGAGGIGLFTEKMINAHSYSLYSKEASLKVKNKLPDIFTSLWSTKKKCFRLNAI